MMKRGVFLATELKNFNMPKELEKEFRQRFINAVNEDNTPKALVVVNEVLKSDLSGDIKLDMILDFDKVLDLVVEDELIVAKKYS